MIPIDGDVISNMCDYSFGDQASIICNIDGGYMKRADISNIDFINKLNEVSIHKNYMTLFIDNIRLYRRKISLNNSNDRKWVDKLMEENDLLHLCSLFPSMRFVIFTNLEDTPIDEFIKDKVPDNVISINAVNALYHDDKINPFPYGLQRKMSFGDNRCEIINKYLYYDIVPINLLYVNHNVGTNKSRLGIDEIFNNKDWCDVDVNRLDYESFISRILSHKFVICPIGNAVDCHRNWEVIYMRRVPVMKKNEYLEFLMKGFPVLFVDEYSDITKELLEKSDYLFEEAQNMDLNKLDCKTLFNKIIKDI